MKNRILILCDVFPPQFAPRMGYLCKYLKEFGWLLSVINSGFNISHHDKDFSFLKHDAVVERICISEKEQQQYLKAQNYSLSKRIKAFFLPDYNRPPGVNEKILLKGSEILQQQKADVILCSTHQTTPLGAAKRLSEQFNIPWIADLRDILEQHGKIDMPVRDWVALQRIKFRRNYLLRKANAVISVSPWHVDLLKKNNPNSYLIYNGYDPDLFKFEPPRITSSFIMCYPGIVTNRNRDLSLVFTALSMLISDNIIKPEQFRLIIYSSAETHEYVMMHARRHHIDFLIDCKDYVKAAAVPDILHQSSILLLLADRSTKNGPNGIMTTKFFEYLGTGRPILLTRSDEACLEQALLEAKAGQAVRRVDDAYHFIKSKYIEWREKGYTTGTTDLQVIKKYSRREQAKQFISIFEKTILKQ